MQTYYDAVKKELGGRAARTRAAMDALDPGLRVAMEGFRPGAYLRLRFAGGVNSQRRGESGVQHQGSRSGFVGLS